MNRKHKSKSQMKNEHLTAWTYKWKKENHKIVDKKMNTADEMKM